MNQDNARWSGVRPVFSSSSSSSSSFLLRSLVRDGMAGQFLHLVKVDLTNQSLPAIVLSLGTFTVNQILAWHSLNHTV